MKKLVLFLVLLINCFAMQFTNVGYMSSSMGGTGVALFMNPYGLHYNPASVSHSGTYKKFSIGLSIDFAKNENKFLDILFVDKDKIVKQDVNEILKLHDILQNNYINVDSNVAGYIKLPNTIAGSVGFGVSANLSANGHTYINELEAGSTLKTSLLLEIPVGYSYTFITKGGDISLGVAVKYMQMNYKSIDTGMLDSNGAIQEFINFDLTHPSSTASVDIGLLYTVGPRFMEDLFTIGIVGKNLTSPKFHFSNETIVIDPLARLGVAFKVGFWTISSDIDLTKNKYLLNPNISEQLITLGTSFDFKYMSLNLGMSNDILNFNNRLYTIGMSIGWFDFGFKMSDTFNKIEINTVKLNVPKYFAFQTGVSFNF